MNRRGSLTLNPPVIFAINDDHSKVLSKLDHHSQKRFKHDRETFQVYHRRWYILLIYSVFCMHQCLIWNTFGPITFAMQFAYGWSDATLAMMPNWGCIMFIVALFPLTYLLEIKGIRPTLILVTFFVALGCCLRTFSQDDTIFLYMAHLCAVFNGISGATVMSTPPLVASLWFPESERIFATSVSQSFNILGNGISFLIGPLIVPFDETFDPANLTDVEVDSAINTTKDNIQYYMIGNAVVAGLLLILFVVYFPNKPKRAPCASSSVTRTHFFKGIKDMCRNKQLWLCCLCYAISNGVQAAWQGVMALNFAPLGVSDSDIGQIGFISVFCQCAMASLVAYGQDYFRDHIKPSLIVLLTLATICFIWLALLCFEVIPFSMWQLYTATVLAVSFNYSCVPLFFEYAVMMAHPVPEGLVGAFLTGALNLVALLFFLVFFIKNIGYDWMNYSLIVGLAISLPLVVLTKKPLDFTKKDVGKPTQMEVIEAHI